LSNCSLNKAPVRRISGYLKPLNIPPQIVRCERFIHSRDINWMIADKG
jgi:hypothetical protein